MADAPAGDSCAGGPRVLGIGLEAFGSKILVEGQGVTHAGFLHDQEADLIHQTEPALPGNPPFDGYPVDTLVHPADPEGINLGEETAGCLPPEPSVEEGDTFEDHIVMDQEVFACFQGRGKTRYRLPMVGIIPIRQRLDG